MRITTQKQYTVWTRALGSDTWKVNQEPETFWVDRRLANNLASKIALEQKVCAVVREIEFPGDPDELNSGPYIQILDAAGRIEQFVCDSDFYPKQER